MATGEATRRGAPVTLAAIAAVIGLVAVIVGTNRDEAPAPQATMTMPPFMPDPVRDPQLRAANGFLTYLQCPVPLGTGRAELSGEGLVTGVVDIEGGFVEARAFRPAGEATIKLPGYRREVLHWHDARDGEGTPCLPLPNWQPLVAHRVSGRLVSADGKPAIGAHLVACGAYVDVGEDGAFAFEGGTGTCDVEPFERRANSSLVGSTWTYDPEAPPALGDVMFDPRAVLIDRWQGAAADVSFRLGADGLVVEHALAPEPSAAGVTMAAIRGLPPGARITAVGGATCVGIGIDASVELAEALALPDTAYRIIQP